MLPEWKSISSLGPQVLPPTPELSGVAIAEIDSDGVVLNVNLLGTRHWNWQLGTQVPEDMWIALHGLKKGESEVLPIKIGGLYTLGTRIGHGGGWMVMGYTAEEESAVPSHVHDFKTLIENIPVLILRMTLDGTVQYVNEEAYPMTGYKPREVCGQRFWHAVVHAEDAWKLEETLRRVVARGNSAGMIRYKTPYDQYRCAEMHFFLVKEDEESLLEGIVFDVTEQAEVEEALLHSEVFYRTFLEQSPVAMVHLDAGGQVIFENHPFRQIVGESVEDAWIGHTMAEVGGLDDTLQPHCARLFESGESVQGIEGVYRGKGPNRPLQHLVFHGSPIRTPDGEIAGAVFVVSDITEQKQRDRELALRQQYSAAEEALRKAAIEDPDEIAFLRTATRILGEATQAERVYVVGHMPVDARCVSRSVWKVDEEAAPGLDLRLSDHPVLHQLKETQATLHLIQRQAAPDFVRLLAQTGACEAIWAPFYEPGQLGGFVVFERTSELSEDGPYWQPAERSRMEQLVGVFETLWAWIQVGNRYRLTVSTIDDALFNYTFNDDGSRRYLFATDQVEMLTGYLADQVVAPGDHAMHWIAELVHPDDQSLVRAHDKTLQMGHESRIVYRILHRDGTFRWLRERATPLQETDHFLTVRGILTDVTEQKAAEEVLLKAKKEAETANRLKTAFIATMSHEIRTPLGSVNGYSQLLATEMQELQARLGQAMPPQLVEFAEAIQERSNHLLTLVNDLFELSHIEMGAVALQRIAIPMHRVIERVADAHRPALEAKGVALKVDVSEGHLVVLGDPRRVEQVLQNLVANAVKFTEHGQVRIRARSHGNEVMIEVADSGIGIGEAHLKNLFTPFAQEEDWLNRHYEGTGLGLTLVKRLMDLMEGRIDVASKKGKGSCFRVYLSAARKSRARQRGTQAGRSAGASWS